jgi:hypothetical protein
MSCECKTWIAVCSSCGRELDVLQESRTVYNNALEEAARVAEDHYHLNEFPAPDYCEMTARSIAQAIRALKKGEG